MNKCKCGKEIPQKRVEILKKNNKTLTCVECSEEQKNVAHTVAASKETRYIQIVSKEMSEILEHTRRQGGVNFGYRK